MKEKLQHYWPVIVYFLPKGFAPWQTHTAGPWQVCSFPSLSHNPASIPFPLHANEKKPDLFLLRGIPSVATGWETSERSSQLGLYLPGLLFSLVMSCWTFLCSSCSSILASL